MKPIERQVFIVNGASGIDRKALDGAVIEVAFVYSGTKNAGTTATLFEQVGDFRKVLAVNTASATNTSFPLGNQSKDRTGTNTGQYVPPMVAGDVVLEVGGANAAQVTEVYVWIAK